MSSDTITATANAAFCQAGDKVEHLLGQALQLDAADHKHIPIAVEMAQPLLLVASLVERVSAGEQLLQEANRRLAEKKANAKLLADQVATLQQELNSDAESMAAEILPIVMRIDAAETLATTALPEDASIASTAHE
ncbi:hypothetical protein EV424DRAFT_1542192 [Suillus variegatus]|nr:hypothetical protein EV424DRAFT_1542192 [Suillus variegatus]